MRNARQYRRILARQERKITKALTGPALRKATGTLTGLHMEGPTKPSVVRAGFDAALGDIAGFGAEVGLHTASNLATSGKVRKETLKGIAAIPAGIIPGLVMGATDPIGTVKAMGEQYKRTYGPALEGDWSEFKRRQGEKGGGGAVQVLADGTIVLGGSSLALGKLGRAGALGAKAAERMNAPRPHLRYSTGPGGVFEQEVSPFFFAAGRQRRRDASRLRVEQRRRGIAGDKGTYGVVRSKPGEVVARGGLEVRLGRGRSAVIPVPERGSRIYGTRTRLGRKQAARDKAQRRILMMQQQAALDKRFSKIAGVRVGSRIGNLAPSRRGRVDVPSGERALLRFAYGGLIDVTDPGRAVAHLRQLREEMKAGRMSREDAEKLFDEELNVKGPRGRFNDNVRHIDMLIEDIESGKVNLDRVAGAARDLRKAEVAIASGRPDLESTPLPGMVSQAQSRRYQPQAVTLSKRGLLPPMKEGESGGQFINRVGLRRVIVAAQKEGMLRPGYWPSEKRFGQRFADRAIGGSKRTADDRHYTGALFEAGMEDIRPEVLLAGLQRGIKRTHNINLIAEQAQKHGMELPAPVSEIAEAERRIAREEGRQSAAAAADYVRVVDLAHRLREADNGRIELEGAMQRSQEFRTEVSAAMNSLDERIEGAKTSGRLDDWRRLRGEKQELEREMIREVDKHMGIVLEHERARATMDALELEQDQVRAGMSPGQRAELPKVLEAEAQHRAALEGLRLVREQAPSLTAEAMRLAENARVDLERAMEGGRDATRDRAGSRAVEAAHDRLARDSLSQHGRPLNELRDDLERAQVDLGHVTFINPGRIYRTYTSGETPEGRALPGEERFGREALDHGEGGLIKALEDGMLDGKQVSAMVRTNPTEFQETPGWMAVPKWVGDEIAAGATPDGIIGRVWDVGKGKFSRVLLGLGNISWLAFQVGSNAMLAGIFGRVGPLDMLQAQRWWGRLSDDQRAAMRPIMGQSAHHLDFDRKYIGAANANGAIINAKRAMESTAWWQRARRANPIDLMFRMDAHQNLFFRRALLYSQAKRRMFERMGESTQDLVGLQDRIVGTRDAEIFRAPRGKDQIDATRSISQMEGQFSELPDDAIVEVWHGRAGAGGGADRAGTYVTLNYHLAKSFGLGKEPRRLRVRKGDLQPSTEARAASFNTVEDSLFGAGEAVIPRSVVGDLNAKTTGRIVGTLTSKADAQVMRYLEDRPTLELHGRKVDELLGDYVTYTKGERAVLQRAVMFYGFVRHSTRLALWTLPTKHPITVAILGKLALLGADEMRDILGGDQLPWGLGKFYFRSDSGLAKAADALPLIDIDTEGKPTVLEIDLARMSPATNAFTEIRTAEQFSRVFPPFVTMGIEQMTEKNLMSGEGWNVRGMPTPLPNPAFYGMDYTPMDHLKVAAGQISRLFPPLRYGEKVLYTGPQGDDVSIFFGDAGTKYGDPDVLESMRESEIRLHERSMLSRFGEAALPMLPRPSEDPRIARQRAKRRREGRKSYARWRELRYGDEAGGGSGDRGIDRVNQALSAPGGGSATDRSIDRVNRALGNK